MAATILVVDIEVLVLLIYTHSRIAKFKHILSIVRKVYGVRAQVSCFVY